MPDIYVEPKVKWDLTDNVSRFPGVHETNHERLASIWIEPATGGYSIECTGDLFDARKKWKAVIELTEAQLVGAVQSCLEEWHKAVVADGTNLSPYLGKWDFSTNDAPLQAIVPRLALAGYKLFNAIFNPQIAGVDTTKLNELGKKLADATSKGEQWFRFTTNSFYAPWNLIYSDNPIHGVDKKHFWGYRHMIEHAPQESTLEFEMTNLPPLVASFCIDDRIDEQTQLQSTSKVIAVFDAFDQVSYNRVTCQTDLTKILGRKPVADHILYFWCHGTGSGNNSQPQFTPFNLSLSDDKAITPDDITVYMDNEVFAYRPLVFLNLCHGGRATSLMHRGFTDVFLKREASAVIGPYTEIPIVFAGEFATRFFANFLDRQAGVRQTGSVLLDLRREFFDKYNNPLGLLYSLYWGADIFLKNPLPKKQRVAAQQPETQQTSPKPMATRQPGSQQPPG